MRGPSIELNGQFFEKIESFDVKIRVVSLPRYQEMVLFTDGAQRPRSGTNKRAFLASRKAGSQSDGLGDRDAGDESKSSRRKKCYFSIDLKAKCFLKSSEN